MNRAVEAFLAEAVGWRRAVVELVAPAALDALAGATSRNAMPELTMAWMTCAVDGREHAGHR